MSHSIDANVLRTFRMKMKWNFNQNSHYRIYERQSNDLNFTNVGHRKEIKYVRIWIKTQAPSLVAVRVQAQSQAQTPERTKGNESDTFMFFLRILLCWCYVVQSERVWIVWTRVIVSECDRTQRRKKRRIEHFVKCIQVRIQILNKI